VMRDNRVRGNYCPDRGGEVGVRTVGKAMRVETMRSGESDPPSLEVANQFNREGSLPLLCRLAPREERLERLLRIFRPHSVREHLVLKFHCLVQLSRKARFIRRWEAYIARSCDINTVNRAEMLICLQIRAAEPQASRMRAGIVIARFREATRVAEIWRGPEPLS
jgi:hypothetical protein